MAALAARLALVLGSLAPPAAAWTRFAVVDGDFCEIAGCQAIAACPENTWLVTCESAPAGYAWLKDGACVASLPYDAQISVKAGCSSMFRSFAISGAMEAECPLGSILEKCFCEDCFGQPARLVASKVCRAEVGRPQALCLAGETQWLVQNAAGIGFVEYCGWAPYQRPQNLPAELYRNDTDCRYVLLDPVGSAGCSVEECISLEDCIKRCDWCSTCSAVLQMHSGSSRVRCYMQEKIDVTNLRPDPFDTGFFVNERNSACQSGLDEDRVLLSRGINGVKLFADLECQTELMPDQVSVMDSSGLLPFSSPWLPPCSSRRCDPGGLSLVASFVKPTVVRCVTVQASAGRYAYGWRLSKTSTNLTLSTGIQNLTEAAWQEVARSGKGMGVRATWDGQMEVEVEFRSSVAGNTYTGENPALLPVVISLLVFFIFLCVVIWLRYFHPHGPRANARTTARLAPVPAVMVPPPCGEDMAFATALTLDEINFNDEEQNDTSLSYLRPSEVAQLQNLLDFTYRSTLTPARPCPNACGRGALCPCVQVGGDPGLPVAFHVLTALRLHGSAGPPAGYVKRRKEIQQKRNELKCLEMSSQLAVVKYPQLQEVIPALDASSNEVLLWYGTSVRRALDLTGPQDLAGLARGLRLSESCTQADEHALDEAGGHYEKVFALVLCRVCLGRFYYSTDLDPKAEEEVKRGRFDSVLLDRWGDGSRECLAYNSKQVCPEFLILYRRWYENQDEPAVEDDFRLEVPIYWSSSRSLVEAYRNQPPVAKSVHRILQGLVDASCSFGRHLISSARQIEDSRLWLRYTRSRREGAATRSAAIQGAIEATGLDCAVDELLLWYLCRDAEEAASASEGSFQSSPRQRRAGIHLSESLNTGSGGPAVVVLLCRVSLGEAHCINSSPDLAAVQSARAAGKDALVALAARGRKDFVLFHEDQLYPQFLLELSKTE